MFITALWPPWSSSQFHVVCVIYMTKSTVAVMEKSHHHLGLFVCLFVSGGTFMFHILATKLYELAI